MDNFLSRLHWVLGEQEKYPWCDRIGVGAGRGNTMFGTRDKAGAPPTADALNAIMRYENISINWLIEGLGAPCLVNRVADDADGALRVQQQLDDYDREVHIISDGRRFALVLTRPDQYQVKDRTIAYIQVEIVAGALAGLTMRAVRAALGRLPVFAVDVDSTTLERLESGHISNVWLLREGPPLLERRRVLGSEDALWQWPEASTVLLSPDEEQLLQHFRGMSPRERVLFLRVGAAFVAEGQDMQQ